MSEQDMCLCGHPKPMHEGIGSGGVCYGLKADGASGCGCWMFSALNDDESPDDTTADGQ